MLHLNVRQTKLATVLNVASLVYFQLMCNPLSSKNYFFINCSFCSFCIKHFNNRAILLKRNVKTPCFKISPCQTNRLFN